MAYEFKFPDVGEGIHEGEIVRWRVKVGYQVKEDQPLVEMETAKAIVEIPSPKSGTVLELFGKEGETVMVGAVLAKLDAGEVSSSGPGVVGHIPTEEKGVVLPSRKPESKPAEITSPQVLPRVRKFAQDMKIDLAKVKGTGANGQITEEDVRKAVEASSRSGAGEDHFGPVEYMHLKGIRKAIADHMAKSHATIPHVTHMDEVDASALIKLRKSKKAEAEKQGIKLTYLAFIIKAAAETLKKHPALNAAFNDETGHEIIYKKYYNIAVAVDTTEGLMLPVIKNTDKKDVPEIAKELAELAQKCRDRKIDLADLQGGTFAITNIGSVGGIYATPIVAYGNTANLGVFRIKEKPVAIDGKVEVRPILSLALSYDHRVVDGAEAARFTNDLIEKIPRSLLRG
ncbi:2-oxo acid dehydrogenase subunit E2 [Candidatus Peregrinibacteria bacterium]|nr:2-oxo acid dehydrogenase subunit E2 [Candidatus Peregrinibacteria bacterium]